jgi:hypothetical protein
MSGCPGEATHCEGLGFALQASHALPALGIADVSQTEAMSAGLVTVMHAPHSALATATKHTFGPVALLGTQMKPSQQSLGCAQALPQTLVPLPSATHTSPTPQVAVQSWEQIPTWFCRFAFKARQRAPAHPLPPSVGAHALPVGFSPALLGQAPPAETVTVAVAPFALSATLLATTW